MAHYTLFVDESGSFTKRENWVLAGVLLRHGVDEYPKTMLEELITTRVLPTLQKQSLPGCGGIEEWHMSEWRQCGYSEERIRASVGHFLRAVTGVFTDRLTWLAIVNYRQIRPAASYPEATYRAMLLDLVALAESRIPEDVGDTTLHLCIASRTIDKQRMTNEADFRRDVLTNLVHASAVELASRGMAHLIQSDRTFTKIVSAKYNWGLKLADIFANAVFNVHRADIETHAPVRDTATQVLAWLKTCQAAPTIFPALSDLDERRAQTAERDGNLTLAIYRWCALNARTVGERKRRAFYLARLLRQLFERHPRGREAVVDGVLEMAREQYEGRPARYAEGMATLSTLVGALDEVTGDTRDAGLASLSFRVRNAMMRISNHIGRVLPAEVLDRQVSMSPVLAGDPAYLALSMDYPTVAWEQHVNALHLDEAYSAAQDYQRQVTRYREIWGAMGGDTLLAFDASRMALRARSVVARFRLYLAPVGDAVLAELAGEFEQLAHAFSSRVDRARSRNMRLQALGKLGDIDTLRTVLPEYLATLAEAVGAVGYYDLYTVARALVDYRLLVAADDTFFIDGARAVLPLLRRRRDRGHPHELLAREEAMLLSLNGHHGEALKACDRAMRMMAGPELASAAPMVQWERVLLEAHRAYIAGRDTTLCEIVGRLHLGDAARRGARAAGPDAMEQPLTVVLPSLRRASPE